MNEDAINIWEQALTWSRAGPHHPHTSSPGGCGGMGNWLCLEHESAGSARRQGHGLWRIWAKLQGILENTLVLPRIVCSTAISGNEVSQLPALLNFCSTLQFTYLKCAFSGFQQIHRIVQPPPQQTFKHFSATANPIPCLPPFPVPFGLQSKTPWSYLFSAFVLCPLQDILCEWDHSVCGSFWLASFILHVFKACPGCSIY